MREKPDLRPHVNVHKALVSLGGHCPTAFDLSRLSSVVLPFLQFSYLRQPCLDACFVLSPSEGSVSGGVHTYIKLLIMLIYDAHH